MAAGSGRNGSVAPRKALDMPTVSYANPADPAPRRLLIRSIELLTGQPRLRRLYREHRLCGDPSADFWQAAIDKLRLAVRVDWQRIQAMPRTGPVVVVSNHPFGVLDGIVLSYVVSRVRRDFRLLAHNALHRAPEMKPFLLPIDFTGTKAGKLSNLESSRQAQKHLERGGAILIFPAGRVSTALKVLGPASDAPWKPFAGKLIARSRATVLPVYFEGQNSRLFHLASRVGEAWREALLIKEAAGRIGGEVVLHAGTPIRFEQLAHLEDRKMLVDHLRAVTYGLAPAIEARRGSHLGPGLLGRAAGRLPAPEIETRFDGGLFDDTPDEAGLTLRP